MQEDQSDLWKIDLTPETYTEMAQAASMGEEDFKAIVARKAFNLFKVGQLTGIIKTMKKKYNKGNTTHYKHYGPKKDLIEIVSNTFTQSGFPELAQSNASQTINHTSPVRIVHGSMGHEVPTTVRPISHSSPPVSYPSNSFSSPSTPQILDPDNFPTYYPSPNFIRKPVAHSPNLDIKEDWDSETVRSQRGPFYRSPSGIGQATLSCRIPAVIAFSLTARELELIKWIEDEDGERYRKMQVHLRLFHIEQKKMVPWDPEFRIVLNNAVIPSFNKLKVAKSSKAFRTVKPIDLTSSVLKNNELRVYTSSRDFFGVIVLETVNCLRNSEMIERKLNASLGSVCNFLGCTVTENLMRCSRCKSAHYCSTSHQKEHWTMIHSNQCIERKLTPPSSPKPSRSVSLQFEQDDDIEAADSIVSLNCPISVGRMQVPSKGIYCVHPECFDLDSYLCLCKQGDSWRCPICHSSLPYKDIMVDPLILKLLENSSEDVESVRICQDGSQIYIFSQTDDLDEEPTVKVAKIESPEPSERFGSRDDPICLD